jgi:hypothetical protein
MAANQDHDPVLALCEHYFFRVRKLHGLLHDAHNKYERIHAETERDSYYRTELAVAMDLWVASLFPLCEGFRKLGLKDVRVDKLIGEMMGALRSASKATSSYTEDAEYKRSTSRLLGPAANPNLNTAEELYRALEDYFAAHIAAHNPPSDYPKVFN